MPGRILVVDDIPANVRLLEAKLTSEYFDVITASGGPQALEVAKAEAPDIVLLDVMMPGMDGFEVLSRLKRLPKEKRPPVMVLTGYSDALARAKEAGADEVMLKPFEKNVFIKKVLQLLQAAPAP